MNKTSNRKNGTSAFFVRKTPHILFLLMLPCLLVILVVVTLIRWPGATRPRPAENRVEVAPSSTASPVPTALPSTASPVPTTMPPGGGYRVVGRQIRQGNDTPFVPYGVQLGGITMAVNDWATNDSAHITLDEVLAARNAWHANTVSLQLTSANLATTAPAGSYLPANTTYLARVDQIVNWVVSNDINILLVLQYEGVDGPILPTQDSVHFWNVVAQRYANRPGVFFDVFNEPRMPDDGDDDAAAWQLWQNGGMLDGTAYAGMQELVNTIRARAPENLIFVDGLAAGEDIHLLPAYTLAGSNLVYAIHPYLDAFQHENSSQWDGWFGDTVTSGDFPVVADEWSEYQNPTDGECFADAPHVVPLFLAYIRRKGVGLLGYALFPGTLIRGWNFADPTRFDQAIYTCSPANYVFPNVSPLAQGVGQLLMNYFREYARLAD